MEAKLTDWLQQSIVFLLPAGVFLAILLAGYALRRHLFSRLSRWAVRTGSRTSDAILTAVKSPFMILCVRSEERRVG